MEFLISKEDELRIEEIDRFRSNHNCFGTTEYTVKSLICKQCDDYNICGKVRNKIPRKEGVIR